MGLPIVIGRGARGFTLVELLVVMVVIGMLLTIAVPRYFKSLEHSREAVLRQDITTLRESIDRFYGDTGKYPETLQVLVDKHYLRAIPVDPMSRASDTWVLLHAEDPEDTGIKDVHSGAQGNDTQGQPYASW
jgi:general secretion pathway protein G